MKSPDLLNEAQRRGSRFLQERQAAILWGSVGTGKTAAALTALNQLIAGYDVHRVLVIGPRLVASRVWSAEVEEWAHLKSLRVVRIVGTEKQRLKALQQPADLYTISRDLVCWLEEQFIRIIGTDSKGTPKRAQHAPWPFDTVVLDESQSFKSQSSKRFKSMRRLRRLFPRIYLLSGSLMPESFDDLWSQLYLVDGGQRLGKTEEAYHQRWFDTTVREGVTTHEPKGGPDGWAAKEILRSISDITYTMLDQNPVVPLNVIRVQLDKKELSDYRTMRRQKILEMNGKEVNAINAGVLWGKLAQLANGAVYDGDRLVHELHTKKLEALVELLESLPRPVLIGYSYIHDTDRIEAALDRAGVKKVSIIRSNASLESWKRGEVEVGIIHPNSAGHGLTDLKDAKAVVWFGLSPGREAWEQLNGRVIGGHRLAGRTIGVHVIVADDTVDDDLLEMIHFKGDTQKSAQVRVNQWLAEEAHDKPQDSRPGQGRPAAAAGSVAHGQGSAHGGSGDRQEAHRAA